MQVRISGQLIQTGARNPGDGGVKLREAMKQGLELVAAETHQHAIRASPDGGGAR